MKEIEIERINQLKSDSLREIALYLRETGNRIIFFGNAWSKVSVDWIYFDTKLDLEKLIIQFELNNNLIIHENLDPKSGTERGLIDKAT